MAKEIHAYSAQELDDALRKEASKMSGYSIVKNTDMSNGAVQAFRHGRSLSVKQMFSIMGVLGYTKITIECTDQELDRYNEIKQGGNPEHAKFIAECYRLATQTDSARLAGLLSEMADTLKETGSWTASELVPVPFVMSQEDDDGNESVGSPQYVQIMQDGSKVIGFKVADSKTLTDIVTNRHIILHMSDSEVPGSINIKLQTTKNQP